jgi:acylphosphatase
MNAAAHIVITGAVQGVGFRYFIYGRAKQLGIRGWVRNLPNGDVEIEAEAERKLIDQLVAFARIGPRSAVVSEVEVMWKEYLGQFQDFEITY